MFGGRIDCGMLDRATRAAACTLALCSGAIVIATGTWRSDLPDPGDADPGWFTGNPYAADSSVHAYVIAQETRVALLPTLGDGGILSTRKRVRRIVRVLDAHGKRHATVRLRLFDAQRGAGATRVAALTAHTHHPDGRRVSLDYHDVYTSRLTPQVVEVSFSFPAVAAGCVLDLAYETDAEQVPRIDPAIMQEDIPILNVEHELAVLDAFVVQPAVHGYFPIQTEQLEIDHGIRGLPGRMSLTRLTADDVPALRPEPHVATMGNYAAHVTYDLQRLVIPGVLGMTFSGTWEDVAQTMRDDGDLTAAMRGRGAYKKWADEVPEALPDLTSRVRWALGEVVDAIAWNGYDAPVAGGNLRTVLKAGEGSSADLNIALLGLLNGMGLDAVPIFLSTREHGRFQRHVAATGSLNHVIVGVRNARGEDFGYVDATRPEAFPGALPERDLNGEGLLVTYSAHGIVPLQAGAVSQRGINADLSLDADGYLAGEVDVTFNAQAALPYLRRAADGSTEFTIDSLALFGDYEVRGAAAVEGRGGEVWVVSAQLRSRSPLTDIGGARALAPTLGRFRSGNPFRLERRLFPVEFATRTAETRDIRITLPPELTADNLPTPISARTTDGSARFRHAVRLEGDELHVSSLFLVKQLVYLPESYPELRGLFGLADERTEQLISLAPPP